MNAADIQRALGLVRKESDLNARAMLFAGLVSELFREAGFEPVIVGGSAVEFYTDGAYMSGDTDICWAGWPIPSLEQREAVMRQIPGVEGRQGKSWRYDDLWVDLLNEVNSLADKGFVKFTTPNGPVVIISAEDALVGRVYSARKWVGYNSEDDDCAKKLMAAVLAGDVPFEWEEARRIAASPKYECVNELEAIRSEVETVLAKRCQ